MKFNQIKNLSAKIKAIEVIILENRKQKKMSFL